MLMSLEISGKGNEAKLDATMLAQSTKINDERQIIKNPVDQD